MDRVHDLCRHWIEANHPDTVLILEALAHGYLRSFRCAEALACLREWQTRQPDNPQALWLEGQVRGLQHDLRAAVRSYQRAVACDPQHEEVRLALINALMEDKDYKAALPHLDSLLQQQLDNLHLMVRLAECHDELGQQPEADRLLETVLARQPSFAPAVALRGKIALRNGQLETAEDCLHEAVALLPSAYELRYQLMRCLDQCGKTAEAREQEQLFQQLQADKRRFNEIVSRGMARAPHDPALHCELGLILLRAGLAEDGVRWLKSALTQEPGFTRAHAALADYYEQSGNREQAASHRRLASAAKQQ
jgi:predicted Zn-dependent protease